MVDYSRIHSDKIATESEADTRARRVTPALTDAGWDRVPASLISREDIAPGRITALGKPRKRCTTPSCNREGGAAATCQEVFETIEKYELVIKLVNV